MSERGDRLRSLVARAARVAQDGARRLPGLDRLRALAGDLRHGVLRIPAAALRAEMLRTDGLASLALSVREDGVRIEASFANGRELGLVLVPERAFFSPRGPKELALRAVPDARGPEVADLAASLASAIVRAIAAPGGLGGPLDTSPAAIVERDADGTLRVDLRTTSALRELGPTGRAVLDAIPVRSIRCEDGALLLELGVPRADAP